MDDSLEFSFDLLFSYSSSSPDAFLQADLHRVLPLIQSCDPDLKLQAARDIGWLAFNSPSYNRHLSDTIEPLVSMLRVGSPESHRESALHALIELATNDEMYKIKIVEVGALDPIISILQSQSLNLQESVTNILLLLSTPEINKPVVGSSGAIPLLVKSLGHKSEQVRKNAMDAILNLSEDPTYLNIIQGTNPTPHIFNWLECSMSSERAEMCSALIESLVGSDEGSAFTEYLVGFDEGKTALTFNEGSMLAIPLLVKILRHGTSEAKMNAMKALSKLSRHSNNLKIILETDLIPLIVSSLENCDKSSKIAEMCGALIESLVGSDKGRTALTFEQGGMLAVVNLLEFGSPQSQEHALGVLLTMCQSDIYKYRELIFHRKGVISELSRLAVQGTPKSQVKARIILQSQKDFSFPTIYRALLEDHELKLQVTEEIRQSINACNSFRGQLSGLIEPLVSMLQVNSPESHYESALLALTDLARVKEKNKIKIVKSGALKPIIRFLESETLKLQEYATECLLHLSTSAINNPAISSSGAIPLLVKILGHESQQVKLKAMKALLVLSKDRKNLNIILGTNPIPLIVDLLKKSHKSSEITEMCSALIECLVGFDEVRTVLTSVEGGVLAAVEVLKKGSFEIKKRVVGALLTMYLSDRSIFREPTLRESILPILEKITVQGEPKFQLKAQTLFLLLKDFPYLQRVQWVTVYRINNNGEWVEQGIHYVTIDLKGSKEMCLFFIAEEDQKSLLHYIIPDDVYGQPQDKIIKWRDLKNRTHLAIKFHETTGFSYIWDQICSMQTNPHFNTMNTSLRRFGGSTRERNDTSSNISSYQKVILEWSFVVTNFILEFPSAVFEQLSSVQKPEYALISMVMSFVAILIIIVELIYKGQKERIMWRGRSKGKGKGNGKGRIPWFYYPPPSDKRFGTFADIVGLGCAIFQFIVTVINYSFICRNVNSPIKISVWPIIFTVGVLCSKFSENPNKTHQD